MAEAEYHAVIAGAAEILGMQSMVMDLGSSAQARVWTDSNAVKATASRRGLGNTRHLHVSVLVDAGTIKTGRLNMRRVPGGVNLADHLKTWREIGDSVRAVDGKMKSCQEW